MPIITLDTWNEEHLLRLDLLRGLLPRQKSRRAGSLHRQRLLRRGWGPGSLQHLVLDRRQLVHEFAHGSFKAVDAPPVDGNGDWVLTPEHINDPNYDDYGASPDNDIQASTIEKDDAIAAKSPDIALRNADNYYEFALLLLTEKSQ